MTNTAQNQASTVLQVGMVVNNTYKILNQIGQGGMSVVWLVMNERANKQWAIKEVRKDGVDNYEIVRQSLIAEVEYLKRLSHANLPSIVDVIDSADSLLIVMDYIEGVSLSQLLREQGSIPQEQVVAWAKQLCAVLGYLHSRKPPIIYRDLKPSNIMLEPDGRVKIIDFGTAREFKEGRADDTVPLGTQGYAAPEQYGNHQTDARTDVYNLGATMYHLVTGHNPAEPPYVIHPIRQWNPNLSSGLEAIINKCTNRDPDDRYDNMAELLFDLERFHQLDAEHIKGQTRKWRSFLAVALSTLVFAGGTLGFGIASSSTVQSLYSSLVQRAGQDFNNGDLATATNEYVQATQLDQLNTLAYQELLDLSTRDLNLSKEENEALTRLFNTSANADVLSQQNPVGYGDLAYEYGVSLYFAYGGTGDKNRSINWLAPASESETLEPSKKDIATSLYQIARNYDLLFNSGGGTTDGGGVGSVINPETFTVNDYWAMLKQMTSGSDLTARYGSSYIAIALYREMIYQIAQHNASFLKAGVGVAELETQLSNTTSGLNSLSTSNEEERTAISEALEMAEYAREQVDITSRNSNYASSGGGCC